jgi:hypothetical protein
MWLLTAGNQFNSWGFPQVPYSGPGLCRTTNNGYVFLMISPNLLDIWPVFFLILSRYETAHF